MVTSFLAGEGGSLPLPFQKERTVSVRLFNRGVDADVVWAVPQDGAEWLARLVVCMLSQVREHWQRFLLRELRRPKPVEVGIYCHGLAQARDSGFDSEWAFERLPVCFFSEWTRRDRLVVRLILTDKHEDYEPVGISLLALTGINHELLRPFAKQPAPGIRVKSFSKSIEKAVSELF